MSNSTLFSGKVRNEAGGIAYQLNDFQALAQLASTGCVNKTFYADAKTQLQDVLKFASKVTPERVAKTAVFSRTHGYMKDMPALLTAYLTAIHRTDLVKSIWERVIDNGKMLRTFVQIVRSGVVGRKGFGTAPKRLIWSWFDKRDGNEIFRNSVGNDPSFTDILRMTHPKPNNSEKEALFGWFLGREYERSALPTVVKEFENWKTNPGSETPNVPFEMLTALPLDTAAWSNIARNAKWQWTRMNLNTMARNGVFNDENMVQLIAKRLKDRELVKKSRCFPYQLLNAYKNCDALVPTLVKDALQEALEIATENVPEFGGKVVVCPDVSGSMKHAVTGNRGTVTSTVSCVDVAGLIAAVILRTNKDAEVLPFDTRVRQIEVNPYDSVMTNAKKLAINGGNTDCSIPLADLNRRKAKADLVIYVSDNQSWLGMTTPSGTGMANEWNLFKTRNHHAKLVCIDIQPYSHTQVKESWDVLNVGGFSDAVFDIIGNFAKNENAEHWCDVIDSITL